MKLALKTNKFVMKSYFRQQRNAKQNKTWRKNTWPQGWPTVFEISTYCRVHVNNTLAHSLTAVWQSWTWNLQLWHILCNRFHENWITHPEKSHRFEANILNKLRSIVKKNYPPPLSLEFSLQDDFQFNGDTRGNINIVAAKVCYTRRL